ncbi:MAG TPA: UDP-2,3-diacylglucosamine diphosphatase [Candidatus Cloacimonadota bacterium]|nr:UDP-2,3-diacylglucosamine diphosphatase [Candidatus Cloacimonadota bacterium]
MRICIVSDVHYKFTGLKPEDQPRQQMVLEFFRSLIGSYDLLVLNGDIFDLWSEGKHSLIKQYFPLLKILADIREAGCKLIYISGNHDFWFGDFFRDYLGAEIYDKSYSLTTDGKRILISHGDLYTINDLRYKIFRFLIRSRPIRAIYSLMHPDLALSLGSKLSRTSSKRKLHKPGQRKRSEGLELYAGKLINRNKYDLVFMGHSHNPVFKTFGKGIYGNSGDWLKSFSYIKVIDGNPELCHYDSKENFKGEQDV